MADGAPPAPSSPPPSRSAASPASSASKKPSKSTSKSRRSVRTAPALPLSTPVKPKSNHSSSFSSPLPPCPEDPPAPPPPSCTPPKYRPLEENDDDTRSVESVDEPAEPQSFPTPPPPPSPPVTSPLSTPPPPPPPPYSPPTAKIAIDLSGSLESAVQATEQAESPPPPPKEREESDGEDGDDEREETGSSTDLTALADASSSSVIASMRSAVREKEIMPTETETETVREEPAKKPRFYIGDIDNYSIIDKVGSGTYGEVFKCQHKVTKDIVALKKLRPDVEKNGFPVTSIREMKILKYLKHPNILELKEIVSSSAPPKEGKRPPLYFAFEYMEHDLSGLLNHPRVKFTRTQIQCYMRQLLTGIAFMHRNKIIHRDIKASNLLLNNQGMLKVGDFGLSRFWNEVNAKAGRYTNKVVTLWYRPPELLMGSTSYDFSVDIWSIGCIFGELLLGKPILQGKTEIEQLDPAKRITAAEAMDHDYFWRVQTCKPRDLPKFSVSSTHEYQSKKRHHEEMAAAAAANGSNPKNSDQHRFMRQRGERSGYRERNDHYRSGGHHHSPEVGVESAITTETAGTENASANLTIGRNQKPSIVIIMQRTQALMPVSDSLIMLHCQCQGRLRKRPNHELEYLRQQVVDLEEELEVLRQPDNGQLPSTVHQELNDGDTWESLAAKQNAQAHSVLIENVELRTMLEGQQRVAQALEKAIDQHWRKTSQERRWFTGDAERPQPSKLSDELIYALLEEDMGNRYASVDKVLGVSAVSRVNCELSPKLRAERNANGVSFHLHEVHLLPFSVSSVVHALHNSLSHGDAGRPMPRCRKLWKGDNCLRATTVTKLNLPNDPRLRLEEKGWIVLEPYQFKKNGKAQGSTLRTAVRVTPVMQFSSEEDENQNVGKMTDLVMDTYNRNFGLLYQMLENLMLDNAMNEKLQ
ncbi:hypothetical protein JG688_00006810 [Phytophthora aleatoria]|uniref:Cyclin-dependent kinase 2 homolog n=1 Tax=Phytophthora aleatoria TaxID=2496075 RepID=A0A8J5MGL5_9STRA|nr:hypothetical protein JG688_00006810 [Phytophthora aleatoria]